MHFELDLALAKVKRSQANGPVKPQFPAWRAASLGRLSATKQSEVCRNGMWLSAFGAWAAIGVSSAEKEQAGCPVLWLSVVVAAEGAYCRRPLGPHRPPEAVGGESDGAQAHLDERHAPSKEYAGLDGAVLPLKELNKIQTLATVITTALPKLCVSIRLEFALQEALCRSDECPSILPPDRKVRYNLRYMLKPNFFKDLTGENPSWKSGYVI